MRKAFKNGARKECKMDRPGKDACTLAGQTFSDGERVCEDGKCFTCTDGEWKEEEQPFLTPRPGHGLVIAPGEDLSDM